MGHKGLEENAGCFVVGEENSNGDTTIATCSGIGWIELGVVSIAKFVDLVQVRQIDGKQGLSGLCNGWLDGDERLFRGSGSHGVLLLGE